MFLGIYFVFCAHNLRMNKIIFILIVNKRGENLPKFPMVLACLLSFLSTIFVGPNILCLLELIVNGLLIL